MSAWSTLGTGGKTTAGAIAALLLGAAIYVVYQQVNSSSTVSDTTDVAGTGTVEIAALANPDVGNGDVGESPNAEAAPESAPGETPEDAVQTPAQTESPDAATGADVDAEAEAEASEPDNPQTPNPVAQPLRPEFDVVRVDPKGNVLVAGRAEPNAQISVIVDGAEVDQIQADATGGFVSLFTVEPSQSTRTVGLVAQSGDLPAQNGEQTVLISPVSPVENVANATAETTVPPDSNDQSTEPTAGVAAPTVATGTTQGTGQVSPETAQTPATPVAPTKGQVEVAVADVQPDAGNAAPGTAVETQTAENKQQLATPPEPTPEVSPADASDAPASPQVLLATEQGISVLQPGGGAPDVLQAISLDSITYDPAGDVALAGRGSGAGFVRVYLDNKPIQTLKIDPDGRWRAPLPQVDTGVYTLRIDEVDEAGVVVSRIETPFKREEPEILAAANAGQAPDAGITLTQVTVQPGNTLWGIASKTYGDGVMYVRVFEANRERIANADLIYPGQVFSIPN